MPLYFVPLDVEVKRGITTVELVASLSIALSKDEARDIVREYIRRTETIPPLGKFEVYEPILWTSQNMHKRAIELLEKILKSYRGENREAKAGRVRVEQMILRHQSALKEIRQQIQVN